jgi:hypothetical protein
MAVKKLPSLGMPSIDFSDTKQLTEFTRKKPKYNTDCTLQRHYLVLRVDAQDS